MLSGIIPNSRRDQEAAAHDCPELFAEVVALVAEIGGPAAVFEGLPLDAPHYRLQERLYERLALVRLAQRLIAERN